MNPLAASVIADNMQTGHFHRMDERASKIAAIWNALTGNQNADGSVRIPLSQTIVDGLAVAQHAIEFAAIAVRRDLAGDGYHDQTGLRLWTQPHHDELYSHPSLGSKTELIVHQAHTVNFKALFKQQVDDANLITNSYENKLDYLVGLKNQFDIDKQLADETYDNNRTQVNLDYYNARAEYSSYLLAATNYHIGTRNSWRPTAMPDIITIPPGFGGAAYTRSLERMVHYKLGQPQFFDSEQSHSSSWRLVRQNPAGSTTWHPKNDNLEGVDTVYGGGSNYGVIDRSDWAWSVPFNRPRPAHAGMQGYSRPDEMFISNAAMTQWVYLPRTSHVLNGTSGQAPVYTTNLNNSPHNVAVFTRNSSAVDPIITNQASIDQANFMYVENNASEWLPGKGSLVFVRLKPVLLAGGGGASSG